MQKLTFKCEVWKYDIYRILFLAPVNISLTLIESIYAVKVFQTTIKNKHFNNATFCGILKRYSIDIVYIELDAVPATFYAL